MSLSYLSPPDTSQFPFVQPEFDPIAIREGIEFGTLAFGPNDMYSKPWYNHEEQRQEYYNNAPDAYYPQKDPAKRGLVTPYSKSSAVSSVPAEIWMEIARSGGPIPVGAPVPLSQVSGRLRGLVQSMPELWSTLVLQPQGPKRKLPDRKQVREWIQKSGNRPLDIVFVVDCVDLDAPNGILDIMKELVACLSRWQHITLYVPWTRGMVELLNRADGPPTMLRSLKLEGQTTYRSLTSFISSLVRYASCITDFHWVDTFGQESCNGSGFTTALPMNFGSLSTLHLDNPVVLPDVFSILSQAHKLVEIKINNLSVVETEPLGFPSKPISLPMLMSMKLVVHFEMFEARSKVPVIGPLLSSIYTPALRHAHFGYDENWNQNAFTHFLQNSNWVQSLEFDVVSMTDQNLRETLRLLTDQRSLESLTIKTGAQAHSPLSEKIVERMAPPTRPSPSATCYVPELRKLCVNLHTIHQFRGQFAEMVARRAASGILKEVQIVGTADRSPLFKRMPRDVETIESLGKTTQLKVTISTK